MDSKKIYLFAVDSILFTHVLFVAFVVFRLVLIFAGKFLAWPWVRNPKFRLFHLLAIGIVVIQSWLGVICPLTTLEMSFREKAGDEVYAGTFISHWLEKILYYEAPPWVFVVGYTAFGLLVLASWFWIRPRPLFSPKGRGQ